MVQATATHIMASSSLSRRALFGAAASLPLIAALPTLTRAAEPAEADSKLLYDTAWVWLRGFQYRGGTIHLHRDVVYFGYDHSAPGAHESALALRELNGSLRLAVVAQAKVCLQKGAL
jgi:hypothetical protein